MLRPNATNAGAGREAANASRGCRKWPAMIAGDIPAPMQKLPPDGLISLRNTPIKGATTKTQGHQRRPFTMRNVPHRSHLFAPGDDLRKLHKAVQSNADVVILELEDGVALDRKALARQTVREAAMTIDFGRRARLIRVNDARTPFFEDDVRETLDARPDAYALPKVEGPDDIWRICALLDEGERARGWPAGGIGLFVMIETPRGILNLRDICEADARLKAIIFGADDYAGFTGLHRTPQATELLFARSAIVNACGAYGLHAIDMVFTNFNDDAGLERECVQGRQLGFSGKQIIHPRQIDTVNRCFLPSETDIAWARRVVEGFAASQSNGRGAFALDGKMIDLPVVRQAERILAQAL
jgi:citrate lyase beta subunit